MNTAPAFAAILFGSWAVWLFVISPSRTLVDVPREFMITRQEPLQEIKIDPLVQTDLIRFAVTAENAYGLLPGQNVLQVCAEAGESPPVEFILKAGEQIAEGGMEMPLVQKDIRHPRPPVGFWKLYFAERGEFLYRWLWYEVKLEFPEQTAITGLKFQYLLNPVLDVRIYIGEILLFRYKQPDLVGRSILKRLPSVQGRWTMVD